MPIGNSKLIVSIWAAWWSVKAFFEELIYDAGAFLRKRGAMRSPAAHNKKCLVIILCETRAQKITFNKFKKNLLEVLDADLALCVEKPNKNKLDRFYKEARYVWTYDKPRDWTEALDYASSQEKGIGEWRELLSIKGILFRGTPGADQSRYFAGPQLFFRWFLLKNLIKDNILSRYERFVITRSDFLYNIPHPPLEFLSPEYIWIPDGEDYEGYTDRHVVANAENIVKYLGVVTPILKDPHGLFLDMSRSNRTDWGIEKFIKFRAEQDGWDGLVRRYPYAMYLVRGPRDYTSWRAKGAFFNRLGYIIKYTSEYLQYLQYKDKIKDPEDWHKIMPTQIK